MPGPIEPPSPSATPKRPSLKCNDSLLGNASNSSCEMSDSPCDGEAGQQGDGPRAKVSSSSRSSRSARGMKRSMSWSDERGEQLQIVHHVWDTHYRRTFFQRHQ